MSTTMQQQYPTREECDLRWEALAREIAATHTSVSERLGTTDGPKGRLVIMGSGIQSAGFSIGDEERIRSADRVFYCVADPPTQVWIRKLRPDAYDMYVLYSDTKVRYHTYMQMTEAMLHYVRRGESVVAVFYGHPGVFVLSTHRAVTIARREGHEATMLPAVSALDCLCADLGVDPAYPGLQTFEATEMLLRQREPDITVHVVLWQVGCIGEMGYRRRGYLNANFPVLVDYLEQFYGPKHELTHYIAARYPTLPPTIARHSIRQLRDARVQSTINGLSTFYIPPGTARQTNAEMARRLGLAQPGQKVGTPPRLREIAKYSKRELEAIEAMESFRVPRDYQFQRHTGAAEFVLALTRSEPLRRLYIREPAKAVAAFPRLNRRERRMLATRHEGAVQIAAKAQTLEPSPDESFVIAVLTNPALAKGFMTQMQQNCSQQNGRALMDAWIASQGFPDATFANFGHASATVDATMLLPWTAIYQSTDGSDVVTIIGDPQNNANSLVFINLTRLANFTFANNVLQWTDDVNPNSGSLAFFMNPSPGKYTRGLTGSVWASGTAQPSPSTPNLNGNEVLLSANPLSVWTGQYTTQVTNDGTTFASGPTLVVTSPVPPASPGITLNGQPVIGFTMSGNTVTWGSNSITFAMSTTTVGQRTISGTLDGFWTGGPNMNGLTTPSYDDPYRGQYTAKVQQSSGAWTPISGVYYDGNILTIGKQQITTAVFSNSVVTWSGAGGTYDSGELQFTIDPLTQLAMFTGVVWASGQSQPATPNINGALSPAYLQTWSGTYPTTLAAAAGPTLFIQGMPLGTPSIVTVDGRKAAATTFVNQELAATIDATSSFDIDFDFVAGVRSFEGSLTQPPGGSQPWSSDGPKGLPSSWVGLYQTASISTNGSLKPAIQMAIGVNQGVPVVTLSDAHTTMNVVNAAFNTTYESLNWPSNNGTPDNNAYANGAVVFAADPINSQLTFTGSSWRQGDQPPAKPNWSGSTIPAPPPPPPSSAGIPWWVWVVVGSIGGGLGGGVYTYVRRTRLGKSAGNQHKYQSLEMQCHEKLEFVRGSAEMDVDPCNQLEKDTEVAEESAAADAETATETNPGDIPQQFGAEPEFEPPVANVDVDVDVVVDTDTDVDVDVDVDVDIDVDIDVDFIAIVDVDIDVDIDVDSDVDNVTDSVTDVETVIVIQS